MVGFREFPDKMGIDNKGEASAASIVAWPYPDRERGEAAPQSGARAIIRFSDVIGLNPPIANPATKAARADNKKRETRQAMMDPLEFINMSDVLVFEEATAYWIRLFWADFFLFEFAPIRFDDTIEIGGIWRSKTALCGRAINQKKPPRPNHSAGFG